MRQKTKTLVIIGASVCLISFISLAPRFFQEPKETRMDTVIASNPVQETVKPDEPAPAITKPAPVTAPLEKPVTIRKARQPAGTLKQAPPKPLTARPVLNDQPVKVSEPEAAIPAPAETAQPETKLPEAKPQPAPENQSSPWGVSVFSAGSDVGLGVTYRLIELPLELDLDLIIGARHSGLGLGRSLTKHLGLGLAGTAAYDTGDKNLGLYLKYSF